MRLIFPYNLNWYLQNATIEKNKLASRPDEILIWWLTFYPDTDPLHKQWCSNSRWTIYICFLLQFHSANICRQYHSQMLLQELHNWENNWYFTQEILSLKDNNEWTATKRCFPGQHTRTRTGQKKIELEWASLNTECQQHKVKMHFDNWLAFF